MPIYNSKSSLLVDRVGMLLFALYQVIVTIVLVNILIAMMSHSFEDVQVCVALAVRGPDAALQWKGVAGTDPGVQPGGMMSHSFEDVQVCVIPDK